MDYCFLVFGSDLLAKAASNRKNSIDSLLEAQNAEGHTALHLACRRGSVELVKTILAFKEADVDILDRDRDPPIVFAVVAGSPECVRALINRSANVSSRLRGGLGPSLTHICALHGQPECMKVGIYAIIFFRTLPFGCVHFPKLIHLNFHRNYCWQELIQMQLMMRANQYCI